MNPQQQLALQQLAAQQQMQQQYAQALQAMHPHMPMVDHIPGGAQGFGGKITPSAYEQAVQNYGQQLPKYGPITAGMGLMGNLGSALLNQTGNAFTSIGQGAVQGIGRGIQDLAHGAAMGAMQGGAVGVMARPMIDGTQFQQNPYLQHLQQLGHFPHMQPIGGMSTRPNSFNMVTPQGRVVGQGGMPQPAPAGMVAPGTPQTGYIPPQAQQPQGATVPNPYLQYLEGNGNVFGARTPLQ